MRSKRGWNRLVAAINERKISQEMANRVFRVVVIRRSTVKTTVRVSTHSGYEARRAALAAMNDWASVHTIEI